MADLQPLLPRRISQSVFPSLDDAQPTLPPLGQAAMGGGLISLLPQPPAGPMPMLNPRISAMSSDPLTSRKDALEADLYNRSNPIKPTTALGKIGHVAAGIGNVLGDIFAPDTMALIPGTQLHNERIMARDKHDLAAVSQEQTAEDQRKGIEATTAYTTARPAIEEAKVNQKINAANNRNAETGRRYGLVQTVDPETGVASFEEDPESQGYQVQAAKMMHDAATAERQHILAGIGEPGTPMYADKQRQLEQLDRRIAIADRMASLRGTQVGINAERLNFDQDKTYNPEPTAQERSKGDLAQSALERVAEMKAIVAKHPEYFGPVAGRAQNAQAWIGSSDPDAVTYNTAAQYLADHSAGVFGGRGQYITQALHGITNPKYTPEGLNAALDEAQRAAQGFKSAGTTHAKGVQGAAAAASENIPEDVRVNGKLVKK